MNRTKAKKAAAKRTREREEIQSTPPKKQIAWSSLPVITKVEFGTPEHKAFLKDGSMIMIRGNLVSINNDRIELNGLMYRDGRSDHNKLEFAQKNMEWMEKENQKRPKFNESFTAPADFAAEAKERDKAKAERREAAKVSTRPKLKIAKGTESDDVKPSKKREANGNGKDQYGHRIGSQASDINKTLDKKPKTVEQMCKECNLSTGRVKSHMAHMIGRNLVKRTKDGKYCLV